MKTRDKSNETFREKRSSRSAKPTRGTRAIQENSSSYEGDSRRSSGRSRKVVSYNEDDLAVQTDENEWVCSKCTYLNDIEDSRCIACDARRPRQ